MLNKNYVTIMERFCGGTASGTFVTIPLREVTTRSGYSRSLNTSVESAEFLLCAMEKQFDPSGSHPRYGVALGSGTTPATTNDYSLEDAIPLADYTISLPSNINVSQHDTYDEFLASYTVVALSDIEIAEIGLFCCTSNRSSDYDEILVDRSLLDDPITLAAGESTTVTYSIKMYYGS